MADQLVGEAYILIRAKDGGVKDDIRRIGEKAAREGGDRDGKQYGQSFGDAANEALKRQRERLAKDAGKTIGVDLGTSSGTVMVDRLAQVAPAQIRTAVQSGKFDQAGQDIGARLGAAAGHGLADGVWRDAQGRLRDQRGRFVSMGEGVGDGIGKGAGKKAGKSFLEEWGKSIGKLPAVPSFVGAFGLTTIGPLAGVLATATVNVKEFAAAVAPVGAALLPATAGVVFLTKTLKALKPAISDSLSPLGDGFAEAADGASDLAVKGIRPLATEFVRLNMPAVSKAMDRIAVSTNQALTGILEFTNTRDGQKAVGEIAEETAGFYDRLADAGERVAISLLGLGERTAGTTFTNLGDAVDWATRKLTGFFDGITAQDVQEGFDRLESAGRKVIGIIRGVGNAVTFLDEHREEISRFSDVAAGGLLAVGVATGNLPLALGAAASLIVRHWRDIKEAAGDVVDVFTNAEGKTAAFESTAEAFGESLGDVREGFQSIADRVGPKIGPLMDRLGSAFRDAQPAIAGWASVLGPAVEAFLKLQGMQWGVVIDGIGLIAVAFGKVAKVSATAAQQVLDSLADMLEPLAAAGEKLHLPFAGAFADIAADARRASNRVGTSLDGIKSDEAVAEVERLREKIRALKGKKVKTEADKAAIDRSEAALRGLQRQIDRMRGKKLQVRTEYLDVFASEVARDRATAARGRADGGLIPYGLGGPREDNVPAWLSSGEFVVNAAATREFLPLLESINAQKYADGGLVKRMSAGLSDLRGRAGTAVAAAPVRVASEDMDALKAEIRALRRAITSMAVTVDGHRLGRITDRQLGQAI